MHDVRYSISLPRTRRLALAIALGASALAPATLIAAPQSGEEASSQIDKRLLQAMQRDLGLDARQAARYLQIERSATARLPEARRSLGAAYAGSWLEYGKDGRFRLVIAATTAEAAAKARAFGAETRVVKRSLAQLETAKNSLDAFARRHRADAGIHAWYVDEKANQVVIEAEYKARDAALDFAAASGIDAGSVRFVESQGRPTPFNIVGGERYNISNGSWCSIGFPVTQGANTGFVTAGHCGTAGLTTTGTNGIAQGIFQASNYPGTDFAWVRITNPASWPLRNWVTNYAGGQVNIVGGTQAPVGAAVCRSGANTGYRCGTINAYNVTVNYGAGNVNGLARSTACAGRGDSGGSFITPAGQAQGVTSGGQLPVGANDNCGVATPVTYHQPLQPILATYGLTLFTGAPQNNPPTITSFVCPNYGDSGASTYVCYVTYNSGSAASVTWSGASGTTYDSQGYSEFFGRCYSGQRLRLTATVTNAGGSVSQTSAYFYCPTGPIP